MLKPFNTEGLDMTFLSDSTYPDLGTTEASNMAAASNPMRGFTPEQTSSLQRMLSTSIGEALEPLLRPLSEFLSAWEKGPQSLSFNTSLTHSIFPDSSFEIQSSTADDSHNHLSPTELVKPSALESPTSPNDSSTKNAFQPNRAHPSNESRINPLAVPASSVDRVPAKRKATGLDEAVIVTFLFNYCPHLLYAFPNFTGHPEFSLTRREAAGRGRREFSIERSGLTVTVSVPSRLRMALLIGSGSAVTISQNILKKEKLLWKNSMMKKLWLSTSMQ